MKKESSLSKASVDVARERASILDSQYGRSRAMYDSGRTSDAGAITSAGRDTGMWKISTRDDRQWDDGIWCGEV